VANVVFISVIVLGALGLVSGVILFFVANKFKVYEDPKIDEVEAVLPKANCGGCGYPGCRAFAEASTKNAGMEKSLDGFFCPVGGNEVMQTVAGILGLEIEEKDPLIAVVRCNGSFTHSPGKVKFEGVTSCSFANALYAGEGGCQYGCLGHGDCVDACEFDAIHMDSETGLPVVNDKCTACGACVIACPRDIIELRKKGPKYKRIFVSCVNQEKGAIAKKNCEVACIGCGKCEKVCEFDAITITSFLAYIDFDKCRLCRKCVEVCPTNAIWEVNFKPRKPRPVAEAKPVEKPVRAGAEKQEAVVGAESSKRSNIEKSKN
jgi:Na+-translocating ferredoxin:NAD+ oxidoreductase RNF subunit RnfB